MDREKEIMTISLTERERRLLLEALNRTPIQGLEAMQVALAIAAKLLGQEAPPREKKKDGGE